MRLIDADHVMKLLVDSPAESMSIPKVAELIEDCPTVCPVKHAHRMKVLHSSGACYDCCSGCGHRLSAVKDAYCSRCGAILED